MPVTEGFVQVPPNSTGQRLKLYQMPDGSWAEAIAVVDANGNFALTAESPKLSVLTSVNLAAGASVDLDATDITTGTLGQLLAVTFAASVPMKGVIKTMPGAVIKDTIFTSDARLTFPWETPRKNWIELTGGAGQKFRVSITNLDNIDAADVYATVYWDEV